MYSKSFYIEKKVWNNIFSYEKRPCKRLFVPSLIEIDDLSLIKLWDEIVFSDYDFDGNLIEAKWLKNFYKIKHNWKQIYLFDNHNHAYYFWFLELFNKNISKNATLIHIDEHSDMRDPWIFQSESEINDLQKVFEFTNFELNVWNYILPSQKSWLIKEVVQIRSEDNLKTYLSQKDNYKNNLILNLDLDFFEPNLDFIDYELKKKVVLDAFEKSDVITICTSPFFIDQNLALQVFYDIFKHKLI